MSGCTTSKGAAILTRSHTPGFISIPFGDAEGLRAAIDSDTVALLVEPIQGEAGVVIPPAGFLLAAREICAQEGVLLIADEVQTGLGRTGRRFACDHEGVRPDMYVLGKALGGGILPVSAVVGDEDVMGVLRPGEHGSTFGGNPLGCAVAREVLHLVADGRLATRAGELGRAAGDRLREASLPAVTSIRQIGLWIGIDVDPAFATAYEVCERLLERGVLCKDAHEQTVRVAPPLIVEDAELDWALSQIEAVLGGLGPAAGRRHRG